MLKPPQRDNGHEKRTEQFWHLLYQIKKKNTMIVEQIYTGCLAQGAYYIESNGEAVVIDPLREVAPYIQKAERNCAKIKCVSKTYLIFAPLRSAFWI